MSVAVSRPVGALRTGDHELVAAAEAAHPHAVTADPLYADGLGFIDVQGVRRWRVPPPGWPTDTA